MINLNGQLVPQEEAKVSVNNRAFNYADAVFETLRIRNGQPLFFESHYFRLRPTCAFVAWKFQTILRQNICCPKSRLWLMLNPQIVPMHV